MCLFDAGGPGGEALDPDSPGSQNLVPDPDGGLRLSSESAEIPFIWIANSAENTVSRLNTTTGAEVGRYNVCTDPSRTAVDLNGDGIITCRGDGTVAKIAILEADCIDRNGNGVIDTSRDLNGNGRIEVGERVANDECVLWSVRPDVTGSGCSGSAGCARAAGVDRDNNPWVGLWNSSRLVQLESSTGAILRSHAITGRPYGLAIASDDTIWVASRSPHGLLAVHPVNGQASSRDLPDGRRVYGLALDHLDRPWVATGEDGGVSRYDPASNSWAHFGPWTGRGFTRGVAVKLNVDPQGNLLGASVFLAHHTWTNGCSQDAGQHRYVTALDAVTGAALPTLDLGGDLGPVGVAVDSDGNLWTVNQCGSSATRFDLGAGTLTTYPVGSQPYTYSDMTGYALRTITAPAGYYRQVFTGWEQGETRWQAVFVDATLPGQGATSLRLRYRVADTIPLLQAEPWSVSFGPYPPAALPLSLDAIGYAIEVEVTLQTEDAAYVPTLRSISALAQEQ